MRFIFILGLVILCCSATVKAANLRRFLAAVPDTTVLKFTVSKNNDVYEVYIKNDKIVKKKGIEFTYFKATIDKAGDKTAYTSITPQFECKGTQGNQVVNECTTNKAGCSDSLSEFTINYSDGSSGGEDPDIDTDTPEDGNGGGKANPRELAGAGAGAGATKATAVFVDNKKPEGASDIQILTADESDKIFKQPDYTQQSTCDVKKDPTTKPVPDGKTLKFELIGGYTVYLSKDKGLKKSNSNPKDYTYYTVGYAAETTQSVYTATPNFVCDGKGEVGSLTECQQKGTTEDPCKVVIYKVQYTSTSNPTAKIVEPSGLQSTIVTIQDNENEANYGDYSTSDKCPTGPAPQPTTQPVPAGTILKFEKDSFTYYVKGNDIVKHKVDEYYYYVTANTGDDSSKSTYTPKGRIQCKGDIPSQSLVVCSATQDPCDIDDLAIFSIKYTPPSGGVNEKAEFDTDSQIAINIVKGDPQISAAEEIITKYSKKDTCQTGGGGGGDSGDDDEINPSDLTSIPQNKQVKSNTTDGFYFLLTESEVYKISDKYQLAYQSTKTNTDNNSTYKIAEDADFIEKKTGVKVKDGINLDQYNCPASSEKFLSLKWLDKNCNKTLIRNWIEEEFDEGFETGTSFVVGANDTVVYRYDNNKFKQFGNVVEGETVLEDKAWIVYPSLLLSIILIIFI